ncbi:hypothetical protein IMSAG192_00495 [Muribaculaceae bacterium]|nr:hypothetical protein IMSAG192_00495 [Muribaculaceae bacterium]
MRDKREMSPSIFLFTSPYIYLYTDRRKKKTEAKE